MTKNTQKIMNKYINLSNIYEVFTRLHNVNLQTEESSVTVYIIVSCFSCHRVQDDLS